MAEPLKRVFISYQGAQAELGTHLAELCHDHSVACWFAPAEDLRGHRDDIADALKRTVTVFVAVLSRAYFASPECEVEVRTAADNYLTCIPVIARAESMSAVDEKTKGNTYWSGVNYLRADDPDFDQKFLRRVALELGLWRLPRPDESHVTSSAPTVRPYLSYPLADSRVFALRERGSGFAALALSDEGLVTFPIGDDGSPAVLYPGDNVTSAALSADGTMVCLVDSGELWWTTIGTRLTDVHWVRAVGITGVSVVLAIDRHSWNADIAFVAGTTQVRRIDERGRSTALAEWADVARSAAFSATGGLIRVDAEGALLGDPDGSLAKVQSRIADIDTGARSTSTTVAALCADLDELVVLDAGVHRLASIPAGVVHVAVTRGGSSAEPTVALMSAAEVHLCHIRDIPAA